METNLVISSYVVGMVQTNFYYMHLKDSAETIVFDPADLGDRIWEALHAQGLEVRAIFLTHAHFDHIGGVEALKAKTGAPVYCSEDEKRLCKSPGHHRTGHLADRGREGHRWRHYGQNDQDSGPHRGQLLLLY